MSSIMRQHYEDFSLPGFVKPAATIRAFQRVQARPRAHVPSSNGSISRKTALLLHLKNVQVMARSHAGSPITSCPKSMTAERRLFLTSRLSGLRSPWTQTRVPSQVVASAASQTSFAVVNVDLTFQDSKGTSYLGIVGR